MALKRPGLGPVKITTLKTEQNAMGLMDYLKTQLLEIIQWQDDSRDTISW